MRPGTVLPGTSSTYYYQFLNSAYLPGKFSDEPMRKLYAAWLERERYSVVLRRAIDIGAQNGVKECDPTVLKIAADEGTIPIVRAMALLGFASWAPKTVSRTSNHS